MNRTVINLVIDLAAALLLIGMMATGYILRFPLPTGTNKMLLLWGLTRHQWGEIHLKAGLVTQPEKWELSRCLVSGIMPKSLTDPALAARHKAHSAADSAKNPQKSCI